MEQETFCSLKGYALCKNQDEVVQNIGYDPEADLENPTGSVFCAHGAGFVVPWDQVEDYMHLQSGVDMDGLDSESWYEDVESVQNPGTAVDNTIFPEISVEKTESFLTAEAMKKRKNCRLFLNVLLGR